MGNNDNCIQKDDTVTIAKGIGIILMVVGHSGTWSWLTAFIYMFHMPLFFILAGYCFKEKYLDDFKTFTWKRLKGLYFPFVKWGLIFVLLHNVFFYLNIYNGEYGYGDNVSEIYSLHKMISVGIFSTVLFTGSEELLGGFWFLIQLFWASLLGFSVIKFMKKYAFIGIIILLGLTVFFLEAMGKNIPYSAIGSLSTFGAAFFVTGYIIKKFDIKSHGLLGIACLFIVLAGAHFTHASMDRLDSGTLIPYLIIATIGAIMTMQFSNYISNCKPPGGYKRFLLFAGENTLQILTWHFLSFKLVSLILIGIYGLPIEMLAMFPVLKGLPIWHCIFYIIAGISIPLLGVIATRKIASLKPRLRAPRAIRER